MLADTLGRPLHFKLAPGQEGDVVQAPAMIEGFKARAVLADAAYDSKAFRDAIKTSGATPVIPSNPTRKRPFRLDRRRYKARNRIERCFNKLKHFRRIATRYDRRAIYFLAFIHLAAAILWMR
jgi:transposase